MADYQLTDRANAELDQIYEYSILNFGLKKAREYFGGFHDCFAILAENPRMGRDYSHVKTGIRRHEYESHSIYYSITDTGILIVQVLHKNQDPGLNLLKK